MIKTTTILFIAIGLTACGVEKNQETGKYDAVIANPVTSIPNAIQDMTTNAQLLAIQHSEKVMKEANDAKIVKLWVRKKNTRDCMRILKIDEINNEVTECNKDRYVELRNDQIEQYKKDNEL